MRYYTPALNLIGRGSVYEIGKEARNMHGKRVFIVASVGSVGEDQAELIASILQKEGIESVRYCQAVPNPTIEVVASGLLAYQRAQCDMIIAVGGGSAMDNAKAIGVLVTNGGHIRDYDGLNRSKHPMPPMIAVATTAGSGSEVTQFAIISDESTHTKFTIVDCHMMPNVSVNDPEMMLSMPPSLTSATGMDALTHAIEAYVSKGATPLTDAHAWKAIALVAENLHRAYRNGKDIEARENMCYGSFLAATAFNAAGLGLVHAMSHPLGGFYNLPHGLCNAILLPHICVYNMEAALEKFSSAAIALGVGHSWRSSRDNAELLIKEIFHLQRQLGIPCGLKEVGVKLEDLPLLAEKASKESIGAPNPRRYTEEIILELFKNAY